MTDDSDDRRAKDALTGELDPKTQADLARWFGLPSFDQLAEQGIAAPEQDAEMTARQERTQKAIEAVEPWLLEDLRRRAEPPEDLIKFKPSIDVHIDPSIALLDLSMINSVAVEPREREIPEELQDDLKDCTPQALLRDLHRSEQDFEKTFEVVDMAAEQSLDIVAEVATAMATNWKLPPLTGSPFAEATVLLANFRQEMRASWTALVNAQPLPNRRWAPEEDR